MPADVWLAYIAPVPSVLVRNGPHGADTQHEGSRAPGSGDNGQHILPSYSGMQSEGETQHFNSLTESQ